MRIQQTYAAAFALSTALGTAFGVSYSHTAEPAETLLEIHSEGLETWPVAPKDEGLFAALRAAGDRLDELPGELNLEPMQGELMALAWDIISAKRAMRLQTSDAAPGIAASIVIDPSQTSSGQLLATLRGMVLESGLPVENGEGNTMLVGTPAGVVEARSGANAVTLSLGEGETVGLDVPAGDLPDGVRPLLGGRFNTGRLLSTFNPRAGEQLAELAGMPGSGAMMMWMTPESPEVQFSVGVDQGRMHFTSRLVGAVEAMRAAGQDPEVVFRKEDLRRVPQDTVRLITTPLDLTQVADIFEAAAAQSGQDIFAQADAMLGVNVSEDVLRNLGPRMYYYQSESTGGGGLLSSVFIAEIRDAEALDNAHARIVDRLNTLAVEQAEGYARIRSWDAGGVTGYSLTAPGLPLPIEPAWAVVDGVLIAAASPMSLRTAVAQATGGRTSVANNPRFERAVGRRIPPQGASSLTFSDTEFMARKGYGLASLIGAALTNAVRSPADPDRVDGLFLPPYAEFVEGIEPSGTVTWWEGEDLRSHAIGDRSVTVLLASSLGSFGGAKGLAIPALGAGILLPAIGKARATAETIRAQTQLRAIGQGALVFAAGNNDRGPTSMAQLIEDGLVDAELLMSPFGPAWDGGPDFTMRHDKPEMISSFRADYLVAIDRAMVVNGEDMVNVCFADNHVETVDRDTLRRILSQPINEGAAEALDLPDEF